MALGVPPWSGKQLRRLGEAIRDGLPDPVNGPAYEDVMVWYNDLAACVQQVIRDLDWLSLLEGRNPPNVTSRPKTIDTLREKLQRTPNAPLPGVQDVAGVRFECEMTLEEQDIVAAAIAAAFGHPESEIHDIRARPHSGYRAVHVTLRLPPGRVEVQVRTRLQGAWANAYEAVADAFGRSIRYGELPDRAEYRELVTKLQQLSLEDCAELERQKQELFEVETSLKDADGTDLDLPAGGVLRTRITALKRSIAEREEAQTNLLLAIQRAYQQSTS